MPTPSLVIGLGGTGTLVATYVKKDMLDLAPGWPMPGVRILAYDFDNKAAEANTVGAQGAVRRAGRGAGAVRLDRGSEFYFIGDNIKRIVEQVDGGRHPHIGSWLQAGFYLRDLKLPDQAYNLNIGAGQFRQFGRAGLFQDMMDPSKRKMVNTLRSALTTIKQAQPNLTHLKVFIAASVAGGTGAGMLADVAHLVRTIAGDPTVQLQGKLQIIGYVVLPDAFSRTIAEGAILAEMHARAFAAMRENERFTSSFDHKRGYPMRYQEVSTDAIDAGEIRGQLFDLLYYVDGQAGPAATTDLKNGVAPAIADAISANIDSQAGHHLSSHVVNVAAVKAGFMARGRLPAGATTCGSFGAFTIVFPIYHIVEGWSHDLALELLGAMLPGERDANSQLLTKLAPDQNAEAPGKIGYEAGFDFLKSQENIEYEYLDEHGQTQREEAEPTLLPGQLADIAAEARRQDGSAQRRLLERTIQDWQTFFLPSGNDEKTRQLNDKVRGALSARLYHPRETAEVQTTRQLGQKEEPAAAADRIIRGARAYKNRQLGGESAQSGRRSGGVYRKALVDIGDYHLARFQRRLDLLMLATLNGQANTPQLQAKSGKTGFLADFLAGIFDALELSRTTLQNIQDLRRNSSSEGYLAVVAAVESAKQQLEAVKKKRLLVDSVDAAQRAYLEAEVRLVDMLKVEASEEAIEDFAQKALDYVRTARESLDAWVGHLATNNQGLYGQSLRGRGQIEHDRRTDADIRTRLVISDDKYEKKRYANYLGRGDSGWHSRLLGQVRWQLEHETVNGQQRALLRPTLSGKALDEDDPEENFDRWLRLCRQAFAAAYQEESLIGYLRQHPEYKDENKLGELANEHIGVMLHIQGGQSLIANFVRAYHQQDVQAGDTDYLHGAVSRLAGLRGQTIAGAYQANEVQQAAAGAAQQNGQAAQPVAANAFLRELNSEDRFKCTFIFTQELVQLENMVAYSDTARNEYITGGGKGDRRWLHNFPAEVNASYYERQLASHLGQPTRLFHNEVTLQLEDLPRVRLFLLALVYGLIQRATVTNPRTGGQENLYILRLEPQSEYDIYGNKTVTDEYWLTRPGPDPHILQALTTFNFEERTLRPRQVKVIDYDHVADTVRRIRAADVKARLDSGHAGANSPDLLKQAQGVEASVRQSIAHDLAQIDRIREWQIRFKDQMLPRLAQIIQNGPDKQKDYDLVSLFVLLLGEEVSSARRTVQTRLQALGNMRHRPIQPLAPDTEDSLAEDTL